MTQNTNLKPFRYDLVIEAEDRQQADRVMIERVGYDEDLREHGVGDYKIDANPVGGRQLDPVEVDGDSEDGPQATKLEPAIDPQGPVTSVNAEQYLSVIRINRALGGSYVLPSAERVYVFGVNKYVLEFSYQSPEGSLQVRLNEDGTLNGADIERDGDLVALTEGALYNQIIGALNVSSEE